MRRTTITVLMAGLLVGTALSGCDGQKEKKARAEITQFYDDFGKALSSDTFYTNPEPVLVFFDETKIRLFDLTVPEQFDSKNFREHFITTSKAVPSKTSIEDVEIHTDGGKVAFVSYIQHSVGKMGTLGFDIRIRAIDGLEKADGKWKIVNESLSLPLEEAALGAVLFPQPASAAPASDMPATPEAEPAPSAD